MKIEPLLQPIISLKWEIKQLHNDNKFYLERLVSFIKDMKDKLISISGGSIP